MTNKPIWNRTVGKVTGWSGLWRQVYGENYEQIDSQNVRRGLGRALTNVGRYAYNQVIHAFVVGTVGEQAYAPGYYIKAQDPKDPMTLGGKRPVALYVSIDRPVTVEDQFAIQQDLSFNNRPTYPVDKSGNGGGGKLGY